MTYSEQRFAKGEYIFKEGTWGDRVYEVVSGEVLIYKNGHRGNKVPLGKLGPGELFGEMFLLNKDHTRGASAVAVTELSVKVYFEDVIIQDLVDLNPRQRKLVECLTQKVANLTEKYVSEITELMHGEAIAELTITRNDAGVIVRPSMKTQVVEDRITSQNNG